MTIDRITATGMYNMCMKKKRYKTYKIAEQYAKKYTEKYGVEQRAYWCPLCNSYHLTTKPLPNKD